MANRRHQLLTAVIWAIVLIVCAAFWYGVGLLVREVIG